jgi:hypothetical protein
MYVIIFRLYILVFLPSIYLKCLSTGSDEQYLRTWLKDLVTRLKNLRRFNPKPQRQGMANLRPSA